MLHYKTREDEQPPVREGGVEQRSAIAIQPPDSPVNPSPFDDEGEDFEPEILC